MARFSKLINTKSEFFNRVPDKDKQKIKLMIQRYGYTDEKELFSCMWECRVATPFAISTEALKEIIEHWRLDK